MKPVGHKALVFFNGGCVGTLETFGPITIQKGPELTSKPQTFMPIGSLNPSNLDKHFIDALAHTTAKIAKAYGIPPGIIGGPTAERLALDRLDSMLGCLDTYTRSECARPDHPPHARRPLLGF